jgi:ribose 5-phosphate isomerase A
MNTAPSSPHADRDAFKRAAAEAAVQLVENDMVVGLGSGSTAAFAVEALARRQRQGLRFVGIPTSERTAAQAKAAGILLTSFSEHRQIDLKRNCDMGVDTACIQDASGLMGNEVAIREGTLRRNMSFGNRPELAADGVHGHKPLQSLVFIP